MTPEETIQYLLRERQVQAAPDEIWLIGARAAGRSESSHGREPLPNALRTEVRDFLRGRA